VAFFFLLCCGIGRRAGAAGMAMLLALLAAVQWTASPSPAAGHPAAQGATYPVQELPTTPEAGRIADARVVRVELVPPPAPDQPPRVAFEIAWEPREPALRQRFIARAAIFHLPDGSELRLAGEETAALLGTGTGAAGAGPSGAAEPNAARTMLLLPLGAAQYDSLAGAEARVELHGDVLLEEARHIVTLPLRAGASAARGGMRIAVASIGAERGDPRVVLTTSELLQEALGFPPREEDRLPHLLLIEPDAGTGPPARLVMVSASTSYGPRFGLRLRLTRTEARPVDRPGAAQSFDPARLAGAEVAYHEWAAVAGYPLVVRSDGGTTIAERRPMAPNAARVRLTWP
jgi:hypothetical protein